jgi:hypothetical protein
LLYCPQNQPISPAHGTSPAASINLDEKLQPM